MSAKQKDRGFIVYPDGSLHEITGKNGIATLEDVHAAIEQYKEENGGVGVPLSAIKMVNDDLTARVLDLENENPKDPEEAMKIVRDLYRCKSSLSNALNFLAERQNQNLLSKLNQNFYVSDIVEDLNEEEIEDVITVLLSLINTLGGSDA